jgi:Fe-S cluster biogenesis protein NfuA
MNQEKLDKIEKALNSVRPYLKRDGGDVRVIEVIDDVLTIEFEGNCSSCSMSNMTLKAGIEEAVKNAVPEIKFVKAMNLPVQ